ncbi:MAG: hypothetical protein IPO98_07205 [Saprospiraceae bacterium]|nr:hypothetical protein [Saprospiraceae bacterium]
MIFILKNNVRYIILLWVFLIGAGIKSQSDQSKKILFVGNSYTYFWNLPQTVSAMSLKDSIFLDTRQSTMGGVSLGQHWNAYKGLNTREIIEKNNYDIVILQDFSLQAIEKPDSLLYYGKLFGELIRKEGAKVYLYMTWARKNNPTTQKEIANVYLKLANEIDAIIVPVGLAWERARNIQPEIELFDEDGSHPSPMGTYLTACVFYEILTGKSSVGLSNRITATDLNGEKLFLNIRSDTNANFLQNVAHDVIIEAKMR